MATRLRERVTKAVAKLESTIGVDSSPGGADFLRILAGSTFELNPDVFENPELRGGYGEGEHGVGALLPTAQLRNNVRGSGAAATPSENSALYQVCGLVETINSSAIAAATASTGTTKQVTIPHGAGWPTTTADGEVLIGQPVLLGGTLPAPYTGQTVVDIIRGYTVSGANALVDLSTTYSAALSSGATTITRPISVIHRTGTPSPHPSLTLGLYWDGILTKLLGVRGGLTQNWEAARFATNQFDLAGFYGGRTDASMLTGETDDPASPLTWVNGICHVDSEVVCANAMQIALNMGGYFPNCPAAQYGKDPYEVTTRGVRVTIDPDLTLVATRDYIANLSAGAIMCVAALLGPRVGGTAGTRHTAFVRNAKLRNVTHTIDNGNRKVGLEFGSTLVDAEVTFATF